MGCVTGYLGGDEPYAPLRETLLYAFVISQRGPRSGPDEPPWPAVGASVLWLQVALVLGASVFYLVELAVGAAADVPRALMSIVVFLLGGAGLGALARAVRRRAPWARTPAVLWNVLLLPVGWSLSQAGQTGYGLALLALAVLGSGSVVAAYAGPGPSGGDPSPER